MKKIFSLLILSLIFSTAYAQDVILKNDKSEIKAKVLEIDDTNIKYKQWDFQDGPTYSIRKTDVFMILYKNGKRETFEQFTPPSKPQPTQPAYTTPNQPKTPTAPTTAATNEQVKPKLDVYRITINLDALEYDVLSLRAEAETPIYKRNLYAGLITNASAYIGPEEIDASDYSIGLSGSYRLPIGDLISPDPNKSLKGLTPFAKIFFLTNFEAFNFSYDAGLDWLIFGGKKGGAFGISVFTTEFKSFNLGFAYSM